MVSRSPPLESDQACDCFDSRIRWKWPYVASKARSWKNMQLLRCWLEHWAALYSLTTPRLPCWRGHVNTLADGPIRVQRPCLGAKHSESGSSSSNCSSPQPPESPLAAGVLPAEFPDLMACRQVILSVPVQISDSTNIIILTREHNKMAIILCHWIWGGLLYSNKYMEHSENNGSGGKQWSKREN